MNCWKSKGEGARATCPIAGDAIACEHAGNGRDSGSMGLKFVKFWESVGNISSFLPLCIEYRVV